MKTSLTMAAVAAILSSSFAAEAALAQDSRDDARYEQRRDDTRYEDRRYNDRRYNSRGHRTYRGRGGDYRRRCDGGNGAVGTVAGGVGGAVIGNAIGGGVLGTVAGGVGGGLLGRHLDKANTRKKNGC